MLYSMLHMVHVVQHVVHGPRCTACCIYMVHVVQHVVHGPCCTFLLTALFCSPNRPCSGLATPDVQRYSHVHERKKQGKANIYIILYIII